MAKHILKRPLKIEESHPPSSLPVGTEINTTDREVYFGTMKCRVILANGREYPAYQADIDEAIKPRDFTQGNLGIRVYDNDHVVIEKKPGVHGWVEDARRFPLPAPAVFDSIVTTPASRLAVAFKAYEIRHPGSELRELLMKKPAAKGE